MSSIGPQKMPSSPGRIDAQTKAVDRELALMGISVNPLDYGELCNVADVYVSPDTPQSVFGPCSTLAKICEHIGWVPIVDAELELVCIAPKEKAELLSRLINTYETVNNGREQQD